MRIAVAQCGSVLFDTPSTLQRMEVICRDASAAGVELLVFPEAFIGGYPKGLTFGCSVGSRSEAGRDLFLRYFQSAVQCPGVESEIIAAWAKELSLHIVVGVIERGGDTLYCTSLLFDPHTGLRLKHRKLMPTGSERLLWGQGDASSMQVAETSLGRIGMAICWENYMPLYRQHLYNQGIQLWCAPTVDAREIWQVTMRHIAYEGRCFVLSACQHLSVEDWPEDLRSDGDTIEGGSLIVSPFGEIIAGPASATGIVFQDVDLDTTIRGKFDLDVAGHYSRPDIFTLKLSASGCL